MRLKTYRAGSVTLAMAMIRAELGADALILSSRRISGGVEVAAGLEHADDDEPALPPALPPRRPAAPTHGHAPGHTHGHAPRPPALTAHLTSGPNPELPRHTSQSRVRWQPPPLAGGKPPQDDTALRLIWHGIPAALADQLSGGDLAEGLAGLLRFAPLPIAAEAPLMVAGAPGAGKTLTIARLATRLVLAGHRPLVISADGRRAGAAEELAAYTRLLGVELIVANKPSSIARALLHRAPGAPVLIDTAGLNPFDPAQIEAVCALGAAVGAEIALVLAAGQDAQEAAEQAEIFAAASVHHFVPTRLDMTRRLGAIVLAAHAGGLTLSEAGTGAGATDGLSPLTPASLAGWLGKAAASHINGAPPISHAPSTNSTPSTNGQAPHARANHD